MDRMVEKESNFVSAVIYLNHWSDDVENFIRTVYGQLSANFKKYEIICVDDTCSYETGVRVSAIADTLNNTDFTVIRLSEYHGCEAAMLAGAELAIGDFVFEFDSTILDFEPELIMEAYHRALRGYDVVGAAPRQGGQATSKLFYWVFNSTSRTSYPLRTDRFRILSRRMINRIHDLNKTIIYRKVAYVTSGLKNDVLLYDSKYKAGGHKVRGSDKYRWKIAGDALIVFTDAAFRFSSIFAGFMAAFTLFALIYTLIVFMTGQPVAGWTTTMLLLSAAFTGIFVLFSVLIKYASMLVRLQVQRKEFQYESVEKVRRS